MEVDVTTQQDDESVRTESDQFMETRSEFDFEHVFDQGPLFVQETSTPIKQASNLLSTGTKLIQPVQPKPVESTQVKPDYIFPETSTTYAQHESLKQVNVFFEQVVLIA